MAPSPAIIVDGLSKRYDVLSQPFRYALFRETVRKRSAAMLKRITGLSSRLSPSMCGDKWALRDFSCSVNEGEVVGLIGHNGSGKSTLLRILSRITEPTSGRAVLRGKVGSLLDVGMGLHPELTGRENIFLGGALFNLPRAEVAESFDAVVDFSGVGSYLDMPVKRYSSGMYVRLAFSIAAHLRAADILLIDEVLAVGDIEFQRKCLRTMEEMTRRQGKTVILVTHNLSLLPRFADRCLLLNDGVLVMDDSTERAINSYLNTIAISGDAPLIPRTDRYGDGRLKCASLKFFTPSGPVTSFQSGSHVMLDIGVCNCTGHPVKSPRVVISVSNMYGWNLLELDSHLTGGLPSVPADDGVVFRIEIPRLPLMPGTYVLNLRLEADGTVTDELPDAGKMTVDHGAFYDSGLLPVESSIPFLADYRISMGID